MKDYIPKWHRELEIFDSIMPVIVLEGNVLDKYQYPVDGSIQKGSIVKLTEYLHYFFKDAGYSSIVFYDAIRGFYNQCEDGYLDRFARNTGLRMDRGFAKADFKGHTSQAAIAIQQTLSQNQEASVVILDFASRYISNPTNMEQSEIDAYTILQQASLDAKDIRTENGILKNLMVFLVNKANDLPAWFFLDNPNVKIIKLSNPSKEEREALIKGMNFQTFFDGKVYAAESGYYEEHPDELERIQDRFVALTEGFSFTELNGLRRLCKKQCEHIKDMCSVIDLYKFGVKENPWDAISYDEMKTAHEDFQKRVKGQEYAITKTLDVIKRAMTGMAGLQHSSHTKPKGILFFAGPTGTGKTEMAKTLAEKLFGDESACIRFDMSEYGQPQSDQKLLGAPPGYVGYEAGGQLTNAVRNNPFSILLFDEIEKAHPSVMDKFLQILEDGRMTDGQGNTVYFSETIIIFTSNLGIYTMDQYGQRHANVTPDMPYDEVQRKVRQGIEEYFKLQLGRPEILNRIGENIVVFDFIREPVAEQILDSQISKITKNLSLEKNIELEISQSAHEALKQASIGNLANGGRGIGNIVESMLINPLSRFMFDNSVFSNSKIIITGIDTAASPYSLNCTVEPLNN